MVKMHDMTIYRTSLQTFKMHNKKLLMCFWFQYLTLVITNKLFYFRNTYISTVMLSSLSVGINSMSHLDRLVEADSEKLVLPPDQVIEVSLHFVPHVEDVGKRLKVGQFWLNGYRSKQKSLRYVMVYILLLFYFSFHRWKMLKDNVNHFMTGSRRTDTARGTRKYHCCLAALVRVW